MFKPTHTIRDPSGRILFVVDDLFRTSGNPPQFTYKRAPFRGLDFGFERPEKIFLMFKEGGVEKSSWFPRKYAEFLRTGRCTIDASIGRSEFDPKVVEVCPRPKKTEKDNHVPEMRQHLDWCDAAGNAILDMIRKQDISDRRQDTSLSKSGLRPLKRSTSPLVEEEKPKKSCREEARGIASLRPVDYMKKKKK